MVRGVLNAVPDPTCLCRRRQGEIDMHGIKRENDLAVFLPIQDTGSLQDSFNLNGT